MLMAGAQVLGPFSVVFLGHQKGTESEVDQLGHEPVSVWLPALQVEDYLAETRCSPKKGIFEESYLV